MNKIQELIDDKTRICKTCIHYLPENKLCGKIKNGKRYFTSVSDDFWCIDQRKGEPCFQNYDELKRACNGAIGTGF